MKLGKKEIGYSTIQYFLSTLSSVIVMMIVLAKVSSEEYAVWNVFLSIQSFVVLIDSGFGSVVVRYVSYAVSGAKNIKISGVPEVEDRGAVNYTLFWEIHNCARIIYRKFSLAGFGILVVFSGYIVYVARELDNVGIILLAWILFSVAVAIDMYYTYLSNMMKGMGKIRENAITQIIVSIMGAVTKVGLVVCGMGLLGLACSYFIQIIVNRMIMAWYLKKSLNVYRSNVINISSIKDYKKSETYRAIMSNSKPMTWVTVSDFLTGKGRTLVCSVFLPLSTIAMFSVTNQLIGMVYSLGIIPYSVFRFAWGESVPQKDDETSRNIYSMVMVAFFLIMIVGTLFCVGLGNSVLSLIKSETFLLEEKYVFLLGIYQIILGMVKISTSYIQYNNIQPYVFSSILSSVAGVVLAIPCMMFVNGIGGYLWALIITQSVYNLWKWPAMSLRLLKMESKEIIPRGYRNIKKVLKG